MDEYFYNDDVDMNPTDEDYSLADGDSTSEDNSVQRHLHEWVVNTGDNSGTPGETPQIPVSPSPPEEIIYVDFPIKQRFVINNYDQTYLKKLHDDGGLFYVIYEDGTEEQCEYTEVINPSAAEYFSINFEVDEITKANNQHFWYDDNGAHVTDETRYSWETNAAYNFSDLSDDNDHNNLLMNSYGLVIRRALKNLAAFSKSAVTFYDGDGNDYTNILASFGKNGAIIGSSDSTRMIINDNGLKGIGGLSVPFLDVTLEGTSSNVLVSEESKIYYYSAVGLDISIDLVTFGENVYSLDNGDKFEITFLYEYTIDNVTQPRRYTNIFHVGTPDRQSAFDGDLVVIYDGEQHVRFTITKPDNCTIDSYQVTRKLYKTIRIPSFIFGLGKASGAFSVSEGLRTSSLGIATHAEGSATKASGDYSHAEGYYTEASAFSAHAEGRETTASGVYSHAEGTDTTASAFSAHAEGYYTEASASGAHAEGYYTEASASSAHAEGFYSAASASGAHAEGYYTEASASSAHAEGYYSAASGAYSHAEGYYTKAIGAYSHAEGCFATVNGEYAHAQNYKTIASSDSQTAIGKFNIEDANDTYAFIIGNGTADNARSNAFTVDWDGNVNSSSFGIMDSTGTCLGKWRHVTNNEILELQLIFNDLEHPSFTNGIIIRKNSTISTARNLIYNANSGDLVIPGTIWNSDGGLKIDMRNISRDGAYPGSTIIGKSPISFRDIDGKDIGFINTNRYSDGRQSLQLTCVNETLSGSEIFNNIALFVDKNNNSTYYVTNAGNFRAAIGAVASSDGRLKTDVQELDDDDVMKFIKMLKPSVYTINGERQVGLIAQDVAKADKWGTNMAFETREGIDGLDDWERMADGSPTWKLDYIRLLPPIIKALQKSIREVDSLKSRIYNLEQNIVK